MILPTFLCALASFFIAMHLGTLAIAYRSCRPTRAARVAASLPPVTVVRPLCGIETFSQQTIHAAFAMDYPQFELLFCVARDTDAIIPMVEAAIGANPRVPARLLVGDDPISINPKLNNMVKGWREAAYPWVAFIDSNVLVPPTVIRNIVGAWREDTGLVTAPPVGILPDGFGAVLECAFLNTHEARWQYVMDAFGAGYAQGKTLFYRKADLDRSGMRELAAEPAEDAASTKMVRGLGLRVRLAPPSPQPLGARKVGDVWGRQLRWARLRRATFPLEFLPEILSGTVIPALSVVAACLAVGAPVAPWLAGYLVVWYGAELTLAAGCRWPLGAATLPAFVTRDLLLPALWVGAFTGSSFTWQGNAVKMERPAKVKPTLHPRS